MKYKSLIYYKKIFDGRRDDYIGKEYCVEISKFRLGQLITEAKAKGEEAHDVQRRPLD